MGGTRVDLGAETVIGMTKKVFNYGLWRLDKEPMTKACAEGAFQDCTGLRLCGAILFLRQEQVSVIVIKRFPGLLQSRIQLCYTTFR